jgi:hypothetical protein
VGDRAVTLLALKAAKGDTDAAEKLALLARKATAFLTEVCESKPELLRPLARRARDWPVIKKKREELSGPERKLFKGIELGVGDFIENDPQTTKWQLDEAGKIAYSLIVFIRNARNRTADTPPPAIGSARLVFQSFAGSCSGRISQNAEGNKTDSITLPKFGQSTRRNRCGIAICRHRPKRFRSPPE